jgi:hypothetical protein
VTLKMRSFRSFLFTHISMVTSSPVTAETAKDAFAKAIEWRVVGRLADVSISDGTRSYSIVEFSSVMALAEIADTIKGENNTDKVMLQNSN